ncbi:MAG: hypothetical protein FWC15_08470, partial [Fibromonadales bacterium]|nr:hypothetical protein [Fibromonadales bacterium]
MANYCKNKFGELAVQALGTYNFRSSEMAHKCSFLHVISSMAKMGSKPQKSDCSRSQGRLNAFCP